MSLRVEKVDPVCSTKSSTHKQSDPYRFLRAQIVTRQSRQQPRSTHSFHDIWVTIVAEKDCATVQNLSETKKK